MIALMRRLFIVVFLETGRSIVEERESKSDGSGSDGNVAES
jgi:hypothetical protein